MPKPLNTTAGCLPLPIPAAELDYEDRCRHGEKYGAPCHRCAVELDSDPDYDMAAGELQAVFRD